jgi:hypothetical protein
MGMSCATDRAAAVAALDAAIAALQAQRAALIGDFADFAKISESGKAEAPAANDDAAPEMLEAHIVARRLGLLRNTVTKWCREEGYGIRNDTDRWFVDVETIRKRAERCRPA